MLPRRDRERGLAVPRPPPRTSGRAGSSTSARRICGSSSTTRMRVTAQTRRRRTTVRPPPGVSSTSISPPIASTNPWRPRGRDRALSLRGVAEPLERDRRCSTARLGTPGPRSTTRTSTMPFTAPAVTRACLPGGEKRIALEITFASARSSRPGSASSAAATPRTSSSTEPSRTRGSRSAAGTISSRLTGVALIVERPRLQPAHVQQIGDEVGEPVGLLVDRDARTPAALRASIRCRAGEGSSPTP